MKLYTFNVEEDKYLNFLIEYFNDEIQTPKLISEWKQICLKKILNLLRRIKQQLAKFSKAQSRL
jgi:hypothetical protein